MVHVTYRAYGLACVLAILTPCAEEPPQLTFESVFATDPEDPIDLVEVVDEAQSVRLTVHHGRPRKEFHWSSEQGQVQDKPVNLQPGEDLLVSQDGRVIGIRALERGKPDPKLRLPWIHTNLRFSKDIEGGELQPLEKLDGARGVHASRGARTLLCVPPRGEQSGENLVEVYSRTNGKLDLKGSYATLRPGRIRLSDDGQLIVQEDGAQLKLRTPEGKEFEPIPAGIDFAVPAQREVLAVLEPDGVRFVPLDTQTCAPQGTGQQVKLSQPPLGVAVAGDHALVCTARTLHWIDWRTGQETWKKTAESGRYASIDACIGPDGQPVLAAGRLEVHQPAGRRDGGFHWGEAQAIVEVWYASGEPRCQAFGFKTVRWTHNAPHVRILGASGRILARSADVVQLSAPVL